MKPHPERRTISQPLATRTTEDGATRLGGYAAVFNEETEIAGLFREQIAPGAFAKAIGRDDVRGLFNHDANWVLARTKNGTLVLSEDTVGLRYEMALNPADPDAARVLAKVARGDVDGSSFAFSVDGDEWAYPKGELPLRTITDVHLYDVSPVAFPAYEGTSVSARAIETAQLDRQQHADQLRAKGHRAARWRRRVLDAIDG